MKNEYQIIRVNSVSTALLLSFVMIMESERNMNESIVDLFELYKKVKDYFEVVRTQ